MKLKASIQVDEFLKVLDQCVGDIYLKSIEGDVFNLKSQLSQYIAIGRLLDNHANELELICGSMADEHRFDAFKA